MMDGMWVALLWMLIGIVFLVKTTPFGGLVRRVRRQPSAIQATVALCLLVAVITGGTKPGGTNDLSRSSQPEIVVPEDSSIIIQQSSLLPSWWTHDATDTDGDGIPDLWEKWTHGNRQVADGNIDRDGDGLTDLEEFQNQTDPRTADTDGDGFDDAFEVANGMNPLVQVDFTPVEPDENQNGIIDLWEDAPYFVSFTDADHDGFDDVYKTYYLEPVSENNYDVVVDVYTTRSAALTWTTTNVTQGFVLRASAGTSVRLRLPFGEDTQIALLPAPEGDDPPSGEIWKSRLRLTFAPRDGQVAVGTCVVSADGDVQQKVVGTQTAIVRFPDDFLPMKAMAAGGYADDWPFLTLIRRRYVLIPDHDVYHAVGDVVGPFEIVNAKNIDEESVVWSNDIRFIRGLSAKRPVSQIFDPCLVTPDVGSSLQGLGARGGACARPCGHVFSGRSELAQSGIQRSNEDDERQHGAGMAVQPPPACWVASAEPPVPRVRASSSQMSLERT